jgi:hypothetical protein
MSGPTFHARTSGQYVIPAPHASQGGTNNFYFGQDVLCQPQPREPFSTVPFLPDPDFIERPDIAAWLRDKCGQSGSRVALIGLGGIGYIVHCISAVYLVSS